MKLSIIIPVYNGAATIEPLVERLRDVLAAEYALEFVLINDASPDDDSAAVCVRMATASRDVLFLDLTRNYGEHNAVMAGLTHCTGDAAVIVDDDFQNPPEAVAALARRLAEGYDVVYSRYARKHHSWFRNLGSRINDRCASVLIGKPRDLYLSSFKALSRFLIDQLVHYTGPFPYIDGLIFQITRNYTTELVEHRPRRCGRSGYTLRKLIALWMCMSTNSSILPLRLANLLGALFGAAALAGGVSIAIERILNPDVPLGWSSLAVLILVMNAAQLLAIGMLGEYLGRLYMKGNGTPQFVVRRIVGPGGTAHARSA